MRGTVSRPADAEETAACGPKTTVQLVDCRPEAGAVFVLDCEATSSLFVAWRPTPDAVFLK